jgi:F-type H+-transporting ATPase subunit a
MIDHKPVVTEFINKILNWILSIFGIHMNHGEEVIPSYLILAFLVTIMIILFFKFSVKNLSIFPNKMQHFLEMLYKGFRALIDDMIGTEGRTFIPALATLGIFIAVANLMGLLPGLGSPTANVNVTAGCALFIFVYYHYQGVKKHGFIGYVKTFAGPEWWLAPLFFPIEIISHLSRPISLCFRLFGNIYGEDMVIIIIFSMVPFIAPLPIMAFAIFTSLLQAFIFVMLSTIYLAGAMAEEH